MNRLYKNTKLNDLKQRNAVNSRAISSLQQAYERQRFAVNSRAIRGLPINPQQAYANQLNAITPLAAPDEYVSDYAELVTALGQAVTGTPYTIELTDDITVPSGSSIWIPYDTEVVLTGDFRLIGANGYPTLAVAESVVLTLDGITVTHAPGTTGSGVDNFGTLILLSGAISGNTNDRGGGVYNEAIFAPAVFTMEGGEISDNTASNTGGGVYCVGVDSAVNILAGDIHDNNAASGGGGIAIGDDGTLNMTGGTIFHNTAYAGGGVSNNGTPFTMEGGEISDNTATLFGGGVDVSSLKTFIMSGTALITGNTCLRDGGGVGTTGAVTITGGEISNNNAQGYGGGVTAFATGSLTMANAAMLGNTAAASGGGAFISNDTGVASVVDNCVISGNTSTTGNGGGLYVGGLTPELNITGATLITDNTAPLGDGGAIWIDYAALDQLTVGTNVVFADNEASEGYFMTDAGDITLHNTNILTTDFTNPFVYGYNNFDISYTEGEPFFEIDDTVVFTGRKEATGAQLAAGLFEFGLFDDLGDLIDTTVNDGFGNIAFPPLVFDTVGTYNFTIRELTEDENGWVTDTTVFPAVVTVTIVNEEISATVDYPNGEPLFSDSFEPEECGLIEFPALTFTETGVYEFTFRELTPSGGGWITDGRNYRVIITVTDENGALVASLEYPDGFPVFENRYEPTQVSVIISGNKVAIGADLICGMFEFGLFDSENNLIATTVNGPVITP